MRPASLLLASAVFAGCDVVPTATRPDPVVLMTPDNFAYFIAPPANYCIDRSASREGRDFYVMAGCALVSNLEVMPFHDGLITVQFGADNTAAVRGSEAELRALLSTAAGVSLLSSNSDPTAIEVAALDSSSNLVTVLFADSAPPPFDGLEQAEWRAFLDIGTRLTTVSVRGFARAPLGTAAGEALLRQAVRALIVANQAPVPASGG